MHLTVAISVSDDPDPSERTQEIAQYLAAVAKDLRAGNVCGQEEDRSWSIEEVPCSNTTAAHALTAEHVEYRAALSSTREDLGDLGLTVGVSRDDDGTLVVWLDTDFEPDAGGVRVNLNDAQLFGYAAPT